MNQETYEDTLSRLSELMADINIIEITSQIGRDNMATWLKQVRVAQIYYLNELKKYKALLPEVTE